MLKLGEADILRVEEFSQALPLDVLCADPALIEKHKAWLSPNFIDVDANTFSLFFQSWVLCVDDRVIVVDPCAGNGRERKILTQFHQLNTPYLERFAATGVRPEDVDYVFCTHLHCDHCGWNTQLRDGRWVPTFPNARYLFVRRETERWGKNRDDFPDVEYNAGVYEDSVLPIIEAGLADLVDDVYQISPKLMIEPAYGHTMGHSTLRLMTRSGELFCTGDAFHHPLQVLDNSLHLPGDADDLELAIATRQRLCAVIAERNAIMLPAHFQAPHGGRVERDGSGFLFKPLALSDWQ